MGVMRNGVWTKKAGFDIKGISDILGIHSHSGRLIAIEVKAEGKKESSLSKEQSAFLAKLNRMNAIAFWADSLKIAREKFSISIQQTMN